MRERLREFDFMRAAAAISIIAIHTTCTYVTVSDFAFIWNQSMRFAVPLFIILSGFMLQYSSIGKNSVPYLEFLKKRLGKIGIPYVLWTLIYVVYNQRHNLNEVLSAGGQFAVTLLRHLLLGSGSDQLYFVVIILQLYLLYPFLRFLLEKSPKATMALTGALTLYFQAAVFLFRYYKYYLPKGGMDYYFLVFPSWIFFFVFGMYAASRIDGFKRFVSTVRPVNLGIIWLASLVLLITESKLSNTYGSSIKPTIMLYCLMSFVFFYSFFLQYKETQCRFGSLLDWISAQSFCIYLNHLLILSLLKSYCYIAGFHKIWDGDLGMTLKFTFTAIASIVFTYIISLTPLAPYIGGVYSGRKNRTGISPGINIRN